MMSKPIVTWFASVFLWFFVSHAFAMSSKRVTEDVNTESTLLDGDVTAIVDGCGHQPIVGFTYCRKAEGDAARQALGFIAPPARCKKDYCAFIKVWDNRANLVFGEGFKKGETRIEAPWSKLLSCTSEVDCHFLVHHRGFYTFNLEVLWLDQDGEERESFSQGDIILRVHRAGYEPLHNVVSDPNFVWHWFDGGFEYRMTSGLRSSVIKD